MIVNIIINMIIGLNMFCGCVYSENSTDVSRRSDESRLVTTLLARYAEAGNVARPILDSGNSVDVQFGIRLVHLDLDEREQVMTTSVWTRSRWMDELLTWDKDEFGGISSVVIPVDKIWLPDIVLVNTAVTTIKEQSADAIVRYNGLVFWAPQRKYSSACLIDVTEYPYDRHTCEMWFQSIANPGANLNISTYYKSPLDLSTYLSSYKNVQEWEIISNTSTQHRRPRDVGMILMWSRRLALRFTLTVQRRAGFKGLLLIVPCSLLSFLIPLIFCFPPERPDRHSLAMSLFASLTILLFMVNEVAPPSASFVPRLALYYCFNLLVLLLATCCSAVVVNINKREETRERVPKVVKKIFINFLGKALCFGARLNHLVAVKRASQRQRNPKQQNLNGQLELDVATVSNQFGPVPQTSPVPNFNNSQSYDNQMMALMSKKLCSIERQLAARSNDTPDVSVPMEIRVEWKTLSMILDRLFFIVFLIVVIVAIGVFHPRMTKELSES